MSKELTIKLSDICTWTGCDLSLAAVHAVIGGSPRLMLPLGLLVEDHPRFAAILQNAPKRCVQQLFGSEDIDWAEPGWAAGGRPLYLTFRLRDGVTVVDDTAEDGEYEFVEPHERHGWWYVQCPGENYSVTLAVVSGHARYICTEVEDAEGKVLYVHGWDGPYTNTAAYAEIKSLMHNWTWERPSKPLIPKNVVFKKGD